MLIWKWLTFWVTLHMLVTWYPQNIKHSVIRNYIRRQSCGTVCSLSSSRTATLINPIALHLPLTRLCRAWLDWCLQATIIRCCGSTENVIRCTGKAGSDDAGPNNCVNYRAVKWNHVNLRMRWIFFGTSNSKTIKPWRSITIHVSERSFKLSMKPATCRNEKKTS